MRIVVTGGCGFIGSSFVNYCLKGGCEVLVVDKMTYASDKSWMHRQNFFKKLLPILNKDICDVTAEDLGQYDYLVNFAAESSVDSSIKDGKPFVKSNIEGTYNLLELARKNPNLKKFVQISTDEVYGDLDKLDIAASFEENLLYPSSYYSSSKASADMLVFSCGHTYGLPYVITRTCNNFGINQHTEKFIPKIMRSIKEDISIPIYGDGKQIREWIWVEDNVKQVFKLMVQKQGTFNIGSGDVLKNIDIINHIGDLLGKTPKYEYVEDRMGHDVRYTLGTHFKKPEITKSLFEFLKENI